MAAAPDITAVQAYLTAQGASWDETAVTSALTSETAAQRRACRIPQDLTDPLNPVDDYPADLAEALCRRVAANLANRALPLGVQVQVAEFGSSQARVGGLDREVRRLEGPFRKVVFG
jgi:hypothetical protein